MKEKFKIGDIIGYKDYVGIDDNDGIQTIGYVIGVSPTIRNCYNIVILRENRKHLSRIGKVTCIVDCFGSFVKLY